MRLILAILAVAALSTAADARGRGGGGYGTGSSYSSSGVRGYATPRGTYVAPYRRTTGDSTKLNNYGTNPNYNPWTGKTGTKSGL